MGSNFLYKKLAVAATKGNLKQLDERRNNIAKREAVRLATANETKAAFEGKTVTVDIKATRASSLARLPPL